MRGVSLRRIALFSALMVLAFPAVARANHHHIGGSGSSGDDPNADCLVWGYIFADGGTGDGGADADAAASDAGMTDGGSDIDASQAPDAAMGDGGSGAPAGAVMVCLEHATLFGCDCAAASTPGGGGAASAGALLAALLLVARRRRRRLARGRRP